MSVEEVISVVKDVVLPVDARTRYDVYFTDRRVGIVCLGRAEREWDTQETLSYMPSAFGVPAPVIPHGKEQAQPPIDDQIKSMSLGDLLKLSKKSCFYTIEEIERIELVWGSKLKFIILSRDCESKFAPTEEQLEQLLEVIPSVEGLKSKLWIAGKYTALFDEGQATCKSCGALNDSDAVYCEACGKKLGEEPASQPASELTCSQCGTKNKAGASFCKQCGTAFRSVGQ